MPAKRRIALHFIGYAAVLSLTGCLGPMRPLVAPQASVFSYQAERTSGGYAVGPRLDTPLHTEPARSVALSNTDSQKVRQFYLNAVYRILSANVALTQVTDIQVATTNAVIDCLTNWAEVPERTPVFFQAMRASAVAITTTNNLDEGSTFGLAQAIGNATGSVILTNKNSDYTVLVIDNPDVVFAARAVVVEPSSATFGTSFQRQTLTKEHIRTEPARPTVGFFKKHLGWIAGYYPMPDFWIERRTDLITKEPKLLFCQGGNPGEEHELRSTSNGWYYNRKMLTNPIRLSENRRRKVLLTVNAVQKGEDVEITEAHIDYYEVKLSHY